LQNYYLATILGIVHKTVLLLSCGGLQVKNMNSVNSKSKICPPVKS